MSSSGESSSSCRPDGIKSNNNDSASSSSGLGTLHLDLDNFDSEDVPGDCPYVLTSPKSLEACKRLRVKVGFFLSPAIVSNDVFVYPWETKTRLLWEEDALSAAPYFTYC